MSEVKFSVNDLCVWSQPDYETALELPSNIRALETWGARLFAYLEDGRTVDLTSLVKRTNQ